MDFSFYLKKLKNSTRNIISSSTNIVCSNCSIVGHKIKDCPNPITSYGIIAFVDNLEQNKLYSDDNYINTILSNNELEKQNTPSKKELNKYIPPHLRKSSHNYKFLMIQRKHTMSFTDIIRGKYPELENEKIEQLKIYINEITDYELELLQTKSFSEIWNILWLNQNSSLFKKEFKDASLKYASLNIREIIEKYHKSSYNYPEFSFPKGRKNPNEQILQCAQREFCEETGYNKSQYELYKDYIFTEDFIGTNKLQYRHIYFLAKMNSNIPKPFLDKTNLIQYGEVSNIGWFSLPECLNLIRPYDVKKKELITEIHNLLVESSEHKKI